MPKIEGLDPNVLAKDILSVQPMTGDAARIFAMRTSYDSGKYTYTWQDHLAKIDRDYFYKFTASKFKIMEAVESMQEKFPGEYTLEEYYDTERGRFKLRMIFDSPEEESMFIMRYSTK